MAYSTQREVSDGTLVDVRLQIEFIDRGDINVFINNVPKYVGVDWDWVNDTLFQMRVPVPLGQELLVQRSTRLEGVLNVFVAGASFDDPTMDENFRQMLFIAQEAREGATLEEIFNDLNMHGYRIRNMADGELPGDAVTYRQYSDSVTGTATSAQNAAASAAAAKVSEDNAKVSEQNAAASAAAALASQTAAASSAATATSQAGIATTQATTATNQAGIATTKASEASASATRAEAAAAGVSLPPARGPRWLLGLDAAGTALAYLRRYPAAVDDTDPDSLLGIGSWGLGGTAVSLGAADINTISRTGFYYVGGGSNGPNAAFTGYILHVTITLLQRSFQIACRRVDGYTWIRYIDGGPWSTWEPLYSGINTSSTIKTFMAATDAASARAAISAMSSSLLNSWSSGTIAVTSGQSIPVTHGLGSVPTRYTLTYVCKVANNGYAVGDTIVGITSYDYAGTGSYGVAVVNPTASGFTLRTGTYGAASAPTTTGDGWFTLLWDDWNIRVTAHLI